MFFGALLAAQCLGWHHPVHRMITRAAISSLPASMQQRLGAEKQRLIERYSLYPDLIALRPENREALKRFCETPDGRPIHNVTWEIEDDLEALEYSLTGMIEGLKIRDLPAAAQHAGVLAHLLEDSTCPAHALVPFDASLERAYPARDGRTGVNLHAAIEFSAPDIDLGRRAPRRAGATIKEAASNLLGRCYRIIRENRDSLDDLAEAAYRGDEAAMNPFRHKAALAGAALLADAYYTAFVLAGQR
jgi:hypothetical protein